MRRILIALVLASFLVMAGCIGGLGASDGGNDTNTSDDVYTGGMDGVEERQTETEFNVTERAGGNTTMVKRSYEGGIAIHLIQWNESRIFTQLQGRSSHQEWTNFGETDLDEAYSVYAPEWYDADE